METRREQVPGSAPAGPGRDPATTPDLSPAPPVEALLRRRADGSLTGTANAAAERALLLRLQRSAGNSGVMRLLRAVAPPGETAEAATASLLVDDEQADPQPHQMRHGEFLDAVERSVTAVAERLLDPFWVVAGCPWIAHWVGHYRDRTAADTESAVRRYAAASATSAAALLSLVVERVTVSIEEWQRTGEMPAEAQGAAPEAALGAARGLEPAAAARMARVVNTDVSRVQIHDDPKSGRMAERLGARAFAVGRHIAFAPNEYAPGTPVGDALLAHELVHVDQQRDPAAGGALNRSALEQDADLASLDAVAALHAGIPLRRRLASAARSGLTVQRCAAVQTPTTLATPARAGGAAVQGPAYTAAAAGGENALDARAQATIALAADTSSPVAERAVAVVRRIIAEYYAGDAAKVQSVAFDDSIESELETEADDSPQATGIIRVRASFVEMMAATRNHDDHSRYVLSVGHEILHINQHRARMGGPDRGNEREFLAGHWTATSPEPAGTGRMSAWMRVVGTIDPALRRYYRMPEDKRREYAAQRDELLQLRASERARNPRRIPTDPPGETPH